MRRQLSVAAAILDHMDSDKHLATIDALCTADLSAEYSGSDLFLAGPGYRIVRLVDMDDLHVLREWISQVLNARWGEQHDPWGMPTLRVRSDRGEDIPEPWLAASIHMEQLNLWQPPGTERWIALGIADRDETDEAHLLAVASDIDPV
ncbi:hypothetical protein GCM10022403_081580 [Streptomyces coacervatus]|uniref:Uncharacterized protein n=2 Tax=Streptomyces coacervatus TaxID=647381 RepID=A0ABP7J8U9_9ACTN